MRLPMCRSFILLLFSLFLVVGAAAQTPHTCTKEEPRYRLHSTQNTWNFIKLDTQTGRMWQVQFSVEGSRYRYESVLNLLPLISAEEEHYNGRFVLKSTANMFNFLLLDQESGRVWQVQWSTDADERLMWEIE